LRQREEVQAVLREVTVEQKLRLAYTAAMSKSDILAELPKLDASARGEILGELWRIEEEAALRGGPSLDEKVMLDRELADYESTRDAGSPWSEVDARLRRRA
jgi:hypothetical protein